MNHLRLLDITQILAQSLIFVYNEELFYIMPEITVAN
jgi:hypothetical protein